MALEAQCWLVLFGVYLCGVYSPHTFYFQVKISTLAFSPKKKDCLLMAGECHWVWLHLPSPGEEEQDVPLPFLGIYVVVFVFSGNGAATGLLFEGLIQQNILSDCLGFVKMERVSSVKFRVTQHGRDVSHGGFPVICSARSSYV